VDLNWHCPFRTPLVPLGASGPRLIIYLMIELPMFTWLRFFFWMVAGLVIYFLYGVRDSRLNRG
jgi:basic amino acid/polyamine antiporter, APA family